MSLSIQLDRAATMPLYLQIVAEIKKQISDGCLPPGTRLPPVRNLAVRLGVTRLTVHTAYSELQADGWVEASVGRGTFVAESAQTDELIKQFSLRITPGGVLENLHPLNQIRHMRNLAYTDPDPNLFPGNDFWDAVMRLRPQMAELLQYGPAQGDVALRLELVQFLKERGVEAMPDELILTSGVTQGLSLVAQGLTQPGDRVLVEHPTYFTLLHILKVQGLRPVTVPQDDEGPNLELMEHRIREHNPRFMYIVPNFHNPTGLLMSQQRRRDLLALAARYNLPIVEDDIYGQFAYDEIAPPALKALDVHEQVIYISSFSKISLPGVRVGYMMIPSAYYQTILQCKLAADVFSPPFIQRALADFLRQGKHRAHLRRVLPIYARRRDVMDESLQRYMPSGVTWLRPRGGLSFWVTLPDDERLNNIYVEALERGVAFTPGEVFMPSPVSSRHMRLCFGNADEDTIRDSVARLGDVMRGRLTQPGARRQSRPAFAPSVGD